MSPRPLVSNTAWASASRRSPSALGRCPRRLTGGETERLRYRLPQGCDGCRAPLSVPRQDIEQQGEGAS